MSTRTFLITAWTWNAWLLLACGLSCAGFLVGARRAGARARPWLFAVALAIVLLALDSPLNALAEGYLFSAHMVQHLALLLLVPILILPSLPRNVRAPGWLRGGAWPAAGWVCGVGAMWIWHVPALCDAASSSASVHGIQAASLVAMGLLFWWPIFAPASVDRIVPWAGVAYLFAACLACTALGILITLTPVDVCPIFREPVDRFGFLPTIRGEWGLSVARDRQIGGLLMWVPMCAVFASAIVVEIARWYGAPADGGLEGAS